jgi:AraC-like DNA-binding protein
MLQASGIANDPLSDVLALLKPSVYISVALDARGPWAFAFPESDGLKFFTVGSGACRLVVEGVPGIVELRAGDCLLLPSGRPFVMASDLDAPPVDAYTFFPNNVNGVATYNGGGEFYGIGATFALGNKHGNILLDMLPPIVHLRSEAELMRWTLARMLHEHRDPQPGSMLVAQHLAHILLVQALRLHLADGARGGVGWLFALADRDMRSAIVAMHGDPARDWTIQGLADGIGMSRSTFALKFKRTVGISPMEYLTRWRMLLAGDRLTHSDEPVAAIGLSLGYESESAFSQAFKRVMGCSPRRYGRDLAA